MNGRWIDRVAALLSLFLLAILAAVSFYLAERARIQDQPVQKRVINSDPDYFIEGFSITQIAPDGKARTRLTAVQAKHRPDVDGFDLVEPISLTFDDQRNITTSCSKSGQTVDGRRQTVLVGNVQIDRHDSKTAEHLIIKTEKLTLLNDENLAKSELPVAIDQGFSHIQGVGMELNTRTRELKIFADVRVSMPARSAKPAAAYNAPRS